MFNLMLALALTVSGNFPRDLFGPTDTRMAGQICKVGPCIWGRADSEVLPITFHPPAGYRVRVLRLRGDLVAQIKVIPGDPAIPADSSAGVLIGFQSTAANGSVDCDYCASGTPLYIQDYVNDRQPKTRAPFDYETDLLLEPDNILNLKLAAWLNTTEHPIHLEGTYTITFRYERQ